jgi:ATP-dependent RNA helicase DeaD
MASDFCKQSSICPLPEAKKEVTVGNHFYKVRQFHPMTKNIKEAAPEGEVISSFANFGLNKQLLEAVEKAGFTAPSAIQAQVIPLILQGKDVVGQAKTGTGKTAAFALPSLHFIDPSSKAIQLLVITPTRELATQVSDEIQRFGKPMGVKVVTVYGGSSYSRQIDGIKRGAQVVVATPGRLLDLLNSKRIGEVKPKLVVLDEADEMLDMGFLEDIQSIFEFLDDERQTLLFSATMPKPIQRLAQKILRDPTFVSVETAGGLTNQDIEQRMCLVADYERDDAIARLIDAEQPHKSIIFCRTRGDVDRVNQTLLEKGYASASLHGDIEQRQREKVIGGFREGRIQVLVATDVAARGLNVVDVSHVFNYHLPTNPESYVHRIGRTGRAGRKGIAYSLLGPSEMQRVRHIKEVTGGVINHASIPTLKDVRKVRLTQMTKDIQSAEVHEDAEGVVRSLLASGSVEDVAAKIVSMFLGRIEVTGPEKIGLPADRLKEVLSGERPKREFRNDRDDRRGGSGGGRFGGRGTKPSFRRDDDRPAAPRPTPRSGEPIKIRPVKRDGPEPTRVIAPAAKREKPAPAAAPSAGETKGGEKRAERKKPKNVRPWEKN